MPLRRIAQGRFPEGIIGIRVDNKDLDTIARDFARQLKFEIEPDDDRDAATIMEELFRDRRALLIFDNAEESNIKGIFPGGRCSVIVTTRDRGLPVLLGIQQEGTIDLSPLPKSQAFKLLRRLLNNDPRIAAELKSAVEILGLVGRLPLALQIVGAALRINDWLALSDYARLLDEEKLKILEVRGDSHLNVRASLSGIDSASSRRTTALPIFTSMRIVFLKTLSRSSRKRLA